MKNHLKRIASPRCWTIDRKSNKFITKPKPGAHALDMGLSLGTVIKEYLGLASATSETKKLLLNNKVIVDGKRRKSHRFLVGLFDTINFEELKKYYRAVFDGKGRIIVIEIPENESKIKLCRVIGKTVLSKNRIQLNLHDGKNIISDKKVEIGDTLMLSLPKLEIKEVLPLKKDANVFLIKGKHRGDIGVLKEITGKEAIYHRDGKDIETLKNYLFVIGTKNAVIQVGQAKK